MQDRYSCVNLNLLLDKESDFLGDDEFLKDLLDTFSCDKNSEVDYFFHNNAVDFTKRSQSITYLVFDNDNGNLVGYFSLAIKPITISASNLSKTSAKRIERVSYLDEEKQTYTVSAYLIAQLGKNYNLPKNERIDGKELLSFAYEQISLGKKSFGGVLAFLECDDNDFLLDFYERNGHTEFNQRMSKSPVEETPHLLHQMMRFI